MEPIVVIADDLTGAMATGALIAKSGFSVQVAVNLDFRRAKAAESDVIVFQTDTRNSRKESSFSIVCDIVKKCGVSPSNLYFKRIDSTLRGNIGAEIDAFFETIGDSNLLAIVAACFPEAGRTTQEGHLCVDGKRLSETEKHSDDLTVLRSCIRDIISSQTQRKCGSIPLKLLRTGAENTAAEILRQKELGAKILIMDCCTIEDIETISAAVLQTGNPSLIVDPGKLTAACISKIAVSESQKAASIRTKITPSRHILLAIGTRNRITYEQVKTLAENRFDILWHSLPVRKLLQDEDHYCDALNQLVDDVVQNADNAEITAIVNDDTICVPDPVRASETINRFFSEVIHGIFGRTDAFNRIIASGGDTALAIVSALSCEVMEIVAELQPLTVASATQRKHADPILLVTKGGMVGEKDALIISSKYMKEAFDRIYKERT